MHITLWPSKDKVNFPEPIEDSFNVSSEGEIEVPWNPANMPHPILHASIRHKAKLGRGLMLGIIFPCDDYYQPTITTWTCDLYNIYCMMDKTDKVSFDMTYSHSFSRLKHSHS